MTLEYPDIDRLSEGFLFNNFNSMYGGNRNLESVLYNRFNLNLFSFSMFNFTNMNASITYTKKANDIKNISNVTGSNQTLSSSSSNSNLADETISRNTCYRRSFGKFKLHASARLNYFKFNAIINRSPDISKSFTQNYSGSFGTNFKWLRM
jgi:hypothetical protein